MQRLETPPFGESFLERTSGWEENTVENYIGEVIRQKKNLPCDLKVMFAQKKFLRFVLWIKRYIIFGRVRMNASNQFLIYVAWKIVQLPPDWNSWERKQQMKQWNQQNKFIQFKNLLNLKETLCFGCSLLQMLFCVRILRQWMKLLLNDIILAVYITSLSNNPLMEVISLITSRKTEKANIWSTD